MNLTRHLFVNRTLARPFRGDAGAWQYLGSSVAPRAGFDPLARRVPARRSSLKVNTAGWRLLMNVLRIR